ncbi:MAG: DUF4249 domain-containing protein [Chitinophagaceae bacterium]
MQKFESLYIVFVLLLFFVECRKPYTPAALTKADNYLVVDGFINTAANGVSTIVLSRTKNLTDTVVSMPETGASVGIVNESNVGFALQESTTPGTYVSNSLNLDKNGKHILLITTAAGKNYQSDIVTVKQTPAIDSVTFHQDNLGLNLFVNTHDPLNNTRYYRWEYVQTWEYHSQLETPWGISNGLVYARTPDQQVHVCYTTTPSNHIIIGTSAALAQDVISNQLLNSFSQGDSTLWYRSSFLVKQYALTPQAYSYWQIIQKNSEQLGTLFDLQPSQLTGNIHSLTDANEPVIGYITATNEQQQRIFINFSDLQGWSRGNGSYNCLVINYPTNATNFLLVDYPDPTYGPYYYVTNGPLKLAKNVCLDCTLSGGVTTKPSFW